MVIQTLKHIIKGWYYRLFDKNLELAKKRIAMCNMCNHREHIEMIGDICAECGCVLDAKVRVEDEHCELNKW